MGSSFAHVHSHFKMAMLIMIRKSILNVQVIHNSCNIQFEIKTRKFKCLGQMSSYKLSRLSSTVASGDLASAQ